MNREKIINYLGINAAVTTDNWNFYLIPWLFKQDVVLFWSLGANGLLWNQDMNRITMSKIHDIYDDVSGDHRSPANVGSLWFQNPRELWSRLFALSCLWFLPHYLTFPHFCESKVSLRLSTLRDGCKKYTNSNTTTLTPPPTTLISPMWFFVSWIDNSLYKIALVLPSSSKPKY